MKKKLMSVLAIVLVIAMSVAGTYAYLTSQDSVTNTFTVGNVAITLDEAKANTDGSLVAGADRVKANTYKLLPGHTYTKDPIIHVDAASENCYLFVKVENEIAGIEATNNNVAAQMDQNGWVAVEGKAGVYAYTVDSALTAVKAGANVEVFETLTIGDSVTNDDLAKYANKTITVTAYAIQADGFDGKTAAEIWTAAGFDA